MASTKSAVPAPSPGNGEPAPEYKRWEIPTTDMEFVFEGIDSAPGWIDKNWAGFDRGPALELPAGDLYGDWAYTTKTARIGDKVVFTAAKAGARARFDVIPGVGSVVGGTKRPPQESAASLEDLLKGGYITPDDLGADAKAQVIGRSPRLERMINGDEPAPEPVVISDVMKVS